MASEILSKNLAILREYIMILYAIVCLLLEIKHLCLDRIRYLLNLIHNLRYMKSDLKDLIGVVIQKKYFDNAGKSLATLTDKNPIRDFPFRFIKDEKNKSQHYPYKAGIRCS